MYWKLIYTFEEGTLNAYTQGVVVVVKARSMERAIHKGRQTIIVVDVGTFKTASIRSIAHKIVSVKIERGF